MKGKSLQISLLLLRVSIFVVMLMWTIDKFINIGHASAVYSKFYYLDNMHQYMYLLATLEMLVIVCFLFGVLKTYSYGLVFIFHAISTISSYQQYLNPYQGMNLLFFAAIPMLAACIALFLLRSHDTLLTFGK